MIHHSTPRSEAASPVSQVVLDKKPEAVYDKETCREDQKARCIDDWQVYGLRNAAMVAARVFEILESWQRRGAEAGSHEPFNVHVRGNGGIRVEVELNNWMNQDFNFLGSLFASRISLVVSSTCGGSQSKQMTTIAFERPLMRSLSSSSPSNLAQSLDRLLRMFNLGHSISCKSNEDCTLLSLSLLQPHDTYPLASDCMEFARFLVFVSCAYVSTRTEGKCLVFDMELRNESEVQISDAAEGEEMEDEDDDEEEENENENEIEHSRSTAKQQDDTTPKVENDATVVPKNGSRKLLVIEDDISFAQVVRDLLSLHGFDADVLHTYEDAVLEVASSAATLQTKYCGVIMDRVLGSHNSDGLIVVLEAAFGERALFWTSGILVNGWKRKTVRLLYQLVSSLGLKSIPKPVVTSNPAGSEKPALRRY